MRLLELRTQHVVQTGRKGQRAVCAVHAGRRKKENLHNVMHIRFDTELLGARSFSAKDHVDSVSVS